jgi:hypothetical protein
MKLKGCGLSAMKYQDKPKASITLLQYCRRTFYF